MGNYLTFDCLAVAIDNRLQQMEQSVCIRHHVNEGGPQVIVTWAALSHPCGTDAPDSPEFDARAQIGKDTSFDVHVFALRRPGDPPFGSEVLTDEQAAKLNTFFRSKMRVVDAQLAHRVGTHTTLTATFEQVP